MMKLLLKIAKREIALLFSTKTTFVFAIVLPFVSMFFFNTLLSNGVARNLPIAVVDLDHSSISRNIISQLNATPELEVTHLPVNQLESEELIRLGKIYGIVTIPKNFGLEIKKGMQVTILNQYNSNVLLPSGLEHKAFSKVIGTISAGIAIEKQIKKGVSVKNAKINFQPILINNHVLSNPYTNYSYYLNSGFLTMFFQLFVILTTIYSFGSDLKYSKGAKLVKITNGNIISIILGKLLPYTLWFLLVGVVLFISMFVLQDFPMRGNKLTLFVGLFLLILANQSFALLFVSISRSFREALTVGSGFTAVSLSFSGITFPIFGMPIPMQWLSELFPFTHFFELFLDQTQRGIPLFYSYKSVVMLVVLTLFPVTIGWLKLDKLFRKGVYLHRI
ncbi:ABC transporter permease [uncultured Lutibacter sp.]|uniref:ABC transporter permease n=1 Tax=uncultured Lutibacter sp. TaxID=437739 RepID=UPI0026172ED0|nr:ABC transporter permease [uncultured Lutibacter sp.]